jgi:hypothetical protein
MSQQKEDWITKSFSATDPNSVELFKAVLVLIDQGLQIEMSRVMSSNTTGEARVHSAGRLDALNDMLVHLQDKRDSSLKPNAGQTGVQQPSNLRTGP